MTASAPASFTSPALASLETVPKTRAPAALASCTAASPTPPAAACTRTVLPGPVVSMVWSAWYAVSTWIRNAAPSTKLVESGSGMAMNAGDTQYSAYARLVKAATRMPGRTFVTPSPTASITPATSMPGVSGSFGFTVYVPWRKRVSAKLTPIAWFLISTQPPRASGLGVSARVNTSGPPVSANTIAFIPASSMRGTHYRRTEESGDGDSRGFSRGPFPVVSLQVAELREVITVAGYVRAPDWPTPVRYAIAVGVALAAAAVRGALTALWGDDLPYLTFVPAIVLSAWAGGFWPGVVTTVCGVVLANYFWLPPYHSLRVTTVADAVGLLFFGSIGLLISALSESMFRGRRRLEGLLHSIDEGFVVFDERWRYRYVNDRAAELLRRPASSMVGKALWDVFPDVVGTEIEANLRRASAGHEPVEFETYYAPYGRWFRTRVFPTLEGFSALLEDTTKRKQAHGASLRLAAIVRSSEEAIVGKDLDGIIHAWNPAAERLFGFTEQEAIGRSIRMIVPADRQGEEDEVLRRLRRGESIEHMETVRVRKDGTLINIALTVSPIRDADGRIIGASKIARDIGERLRAESERVRLLTAEQAARARAESAERRATLLSESSAALSASLDSATTLRTVSRLVVPRFADWCIVDLVTRENTFERVAVSAAGPDAETLLGELQRYAPDWTSSQPAAEAVRSRTAIVIPEVTEETLVSTARDERHLAIVRRLRPQSAIAVPMVVRQRIIGAITLVRTVAGRPYDTADVAMAEELAGRAALAVDNATLYSEADQARAQAEGANRAKDEFLAVLSHELRTPMNAVYGWARMLQMGQIDAGTTPRALDAIVRNAHVQLQLIDDLLDVSRIISGKMRLDIRPVDIHRV